MHCHVLIALVVVFNDVSTHPVDGAVLEERETERIIGGLDAFPGQFPWTAALFYNGQFICTSSIISPTTVLTVAHCVVFNGITPDPENFHAIANVSKSASTVRINFREINAHPNYNVEQLDSDLAVLKTTEPIPLSEEVKPVCIAGRRPAKRYLFATAMGWGNQDRSQISLPDRLQWVKQVIVDNRLCSRLNPGVNDAKICAIGLLTGVCNGDSGGPLVHISGVKPPVQIGITSYVNDRTPCGQGLPAVWTRVSSYYDFIMKTANDSSICTG